MALEPHTRGIWHGCWHPLIFGTEQLLNRQRGTGYRLGDGSVVTEGIKA